MRWDVFPLLFNRQLLLPLICWRGGGHEMLDVQYRGASSLLSFVHSLTRSFVGQLCLMLPVHLGPEEACGAGAGRGTVGSEQGEERARAEPEVRPHLKDRG